MMHVSERKVQIQTAIVMKKHHYIGTCGFHHLVGGFKHYLMVTPSWGNDPI